MSDLKTTSGRGDAPVEATGTGMPDTQPVTTSPRSAEEALHVHFETKTPSTENALMGSKSPGKKGRPSLRSQSSFGGRLMASLSRTLSALTPRRKEEEGWEDVEVPERFLTACGGKKKKAVAMYRSMLKWRKENGIDTILERPYPQWDNIKKYYPHAMHCRGRQEEFVSIEMPGKMDLAAMRKAGLTPTVMGLHLAFAFEYAFTQVDTREEIRSITIMDCTSLSLASAASVDNLGLIKAVCEVNSYYYPGRAHKILAVNPPRFFGPVFNIIKNVLPNGLNHVVECVSHKELHKYVDPSLLPPQLGGTSTVPVGESESEKTFREFVAKLNARSTAY
uniref:Sec14 cytosolic n=1 Tax=Nannochloropsis gaditana (strain CCMP526) TaxID=1093141 RepID=I2CP95_NANGC